MSALPWSFSSLKKYETCPRQFYETRVARSVVEEQGEAAAIGSQVHHLFESSIAGDQTFPSSLARYGRYAETVRQWLGETRTEVKLGITDSMTPAGFDDPACWGRGSIDVLNILEDRARIVDWKTGKRRPQDSHAQASVYAALVFINYPQVQNVRALWVYLNQSAVDTYDFIREQLPTLLRASRSTVNDIEWSLETNVWPERPSGLCNGWCPVKHCAHWRGKRTSRSEEQEKESSCL